VITGELKSKIDRVWDAFWSGGISNPVEVIEQITYLLFIRRLDDTAHARREQGERDPQADREPGVPARPRSTCGGAGSRTT
jgi:type I restriction enzyme M protein